MGPSSKGIGPKITDCFEIAYFFYEQAVIFFDGIYNLKKIRGILHFMFAALARSPGGTEYGGCRGMLNLYGEKRIRIHK